jgi:hypothetical protein
MPPERNRNLPSGEFPATEKEVRPTSKTTSKDAARIQSQADKTGTNQDFKARIQAAAAKNEKK